MQNLNTSVYTFDGFQVDLLRRRLSKKGNAIPLKPKAFDLLAVLVEHNGTLLTKEELFRMVWDERLVEDSNLTVSMSAIRRALGERASDPKYITNVSGKGYYFNAAINDEVDGDVIIESHTLSRVVVESEQNADAAPAARRQPRPLVARYRLPLVAFAMSSLLIGFGYLLMVRPSVRGAAQFPQLTMRRLTTNGRVIRSTLSPDGKLYAFTQDETGGRQTMWLGHVEGGELLQIRGPVTQVYGKMSFSPDGSHIYYHLLESDSASTSTLFRMPSFGGAAEKVKDNLPGYAAFSNDGKQIAFVRNEEERHRSILVKVNLDGSAEREVASRPLELGFGAWTIAWAPDDKSLAVSARVNEKDAEVAEVFLVRAHDGYVTPLTSVQWNTVAGLKWKSDSSGLVAIAAEKGNALARELWSISYPSGEIRRMITDLGTYYGVDLCGDGSEVISVQGQNYSNIWVAPASDIAAAKQVTFDMLGKQAGWSGLDWTPDGRIVFASSVGSNETIWQMKADGSEQRQLVPDGRVNNYLSLPDSGGSILFQSDRSGGNEYWRSDADGSNLKQLTTGGDNWDPHVSPDGGTVLYNTTVNGAASLNTMRSDGSEKKPIVVGSADFARFSPDGKLIAYVADAGKKSKIFVIPSEGGEALKSFDPPVTANFRLGVHWTPDGRAITFRDWKNGVWKQDLAGGAPVRIEGIPEEKIYAYGWSRDGKSFAYARGLAIRDVVLISKAEN